MSDAAAAMTPARSMQLPAKTGLAPIQKAVIILTAIGPELAARVLKEVTPAGLKRFAAATASLGTIGQEVLDQVIVEFLEALTVGADLAGGEDAARRLLGGILEEAQIQELLGDRSQLGVWERMGTAPIAAVASYVGNEHPQTAAVILSELKSDMAASVLERLNQDFARDIVLRLGRVPALDRRTSEALMAAVERDFLSALQRGLTKRRPADLIAGLMNNISSEAREGFLVHLEGAMPELAQDVQRSMFTFDDIATRLPARDIGTLVREMPEEILMPALKFGQMQGSDSVGFILENLPRRLAERYVEDLAMMDDVPRKEGEAAHIELTKFVLERQKAGQITFLDRDEA